MRQQKYFPEKKLLTKSIKQYVNQHRLLIKKIDHTNKIYLLLTCPLELIKLNYTTDQIGIIKINFN